MRYRRNADEDIRDLEREYYMGDPNSILRLANAHIRSGTLPVSFLIRHPEVFELLHPEWQQALWEQAHQFMTGSPPPQPTQSEYCATCQIPEHEQCSLTAGCPCCEDTIENLPAGPENVLYGPEEEFEEDEDEDEDEISAQDAADYESGNYWSCASCEEDLFASTQNENWALLTDASAAVTTAKIGRGDEGQAMCESCLSQAGLDLEEAVQEELEDYCSECGEELDECVCD